MDIGNLKEDFVAVISESEFANSYKLIYDELILFYENAPMYPVHIEENTYGIMYALKEKSVKVLFKVES